MSDTFAIEYGVAISDKLSITRLTKLLEAVKSLHPDEFYMGEWCRYNSTKCKTTHCLAGAALTHPYFKRLGVRMGASGIDYPDGMDHTDFYGITREQASTLFYSWHKTGARGKIAKKAKIKQLELLIKAKKEGLA